MIDPRLEHLARDGRADLVVLEAVAAAEVAAAGDDEVRDDRAVAVEGGGGEAGGDLEVAGRGSGGGAGAGRSGGRGDGRGGGGRRARRRGRWARGSEMRAAAGESVEAVMRSNHCQWRAARNYSPPGAMSSARCPFLGASVGSFIAITAGTTTNAAAMHVISPISDAIPKPRMARLSLASSDR